MAFLIWFTGVLQEKRRPERLSAPAVVRQVFHLENILQTYCILTVSLNQDIWEEKSYLLIILYTIHCILQANFYYESMIFANCYIMVKEAGFLPIF